VLCFEGGRRLPKHAARLIIYVTYIYSVLYCCHLLSTQFQFNTHILPNKCTHISHYYGSNVQQHVPSHNDLNQLNTSVTTRQAGQSKKMAEARLSFEERKTITILIQFFTSLKRVYLFLAPSVYWLMYQMLLFNDQQPNSLITSNRNTPQSVSLLYINVTVGCAPV
jgi:hypothetical protein